MNTEKTKPARGSGVQPDHILLSINGDARHTMTVTWRNCTDVTTGYCLYKETGTDTWLRCDAESHIFESDIDCSRIFSAHIPDLKPGTKYEYTCGSDEHRSAVFSFETEPENCTKFSFVCVSDQQCGWPFLTPDYSGFHKFLKDVLAKHPKARFIYTGGDNTDCGQHEQQWNGLFSGLAGVAESIPFMMTMGNHDNRGFRFYRENDSEGRFYAEPATFFNTQFKGAYACNGPDGWTPENYTFDYGNCHFTVYGVNEPVLVNEWSAKDLANCSKTWKIASYHFPICYSIPEGSNYDAYPMMMQCMEMNDLMFSGHEHNFARSFPRRNEQLFDRPSQGTVHYTLGNANGHPPGSRSIPKVWHCAFNPQEEYRYFYTLVEVDGNQMTLTAYFDDGRIVDQCTIDKDKDEIRPYAVAPVYSQTRMMYKGAEPGLAACQTPPENKDGTWFIPASVLAHYIGADVQTAKGEIGISMYGTTAVFTENSEKCTVNGEEKQMAAAVYRGKREQLYVPVDDFCKIFDMKWCYAERNNFISIEKESEDKPVPEQP